MYQKALPLEFIQLLAPLTDGVFRLQNGIFLDWLELRILSPLSVSWAFPLLLILMLTALSSPLLMYAVVLYWFGADAVLFICFGGLFLLWARDPPAVPPSPPFCGFLEENKFLFSSSSSVSSSSISPLLPEVELEDVRHCTKHKKIRTIT